MNVDLLTRCSNAAALSGFEARLRCIIRDELQGRCSRISRRPAGNLICRSGAGGPAVALLAHIDDVGRVAAMRPSKSAA